MGWGDGMRHGVACQCGNNSCCNANQPARPAQPTTAARRRRRGPHHHHLPRTRAQMPINALLAMCQVALDKQRSKLTLLALNRREEKRREEIDVTYLRYNVLKVPYALNLIRIKYTTKHNICFPLYLSHC